MPPTAKWTAAEAAGDDVSKKMLITYLQENGDEAFLTANKLNGQANAIVKRITKEQLVETYKTFIGDSTPAPPKAPAAGGSPFGVPAPPPTGSSFSFSPPGGDKSPFTFAAAPAEAAGSNFTFSFNAPAGGAKGDDGDDGDDDEEDDDVEEVDTSKMKTRGGGKGLDIPAELQKRMERLNMSAAQRRDATLAELPPPVRTRVESLEKLQEDVDAVSKEFEEKLQALKDEYEKKKAPLFKQRFDIVKPKEGEEGVPSFWLTAIQNNSARRRISGLAVPITPPLPSCPPLPPALAPPS